MNNKIYIIQYTDYDYIKRKYMSIKQFELKYTNQLNQKFIK